MATLQEYIKRLDEQNLIWPKPPNPQPLNAAPFVKPLKGIRGVTWSVYGTLLRISGGRLIFDSEAPLQMQVALEKTIQEFNMWQSMPRKAGAPWEQLYSQYKQVLSEQQMVGVRVKGDFPEVDSTKIWMKLISRLQLKEYEYDVSFYGNLEEFSAKVAYFFHANLQGVDASPGALESLQAVSESEISQGLLADAQVFTFQQMLRALRGQGTLPVLEALMDAGCVTFSCREGVRKPSKTLYRNSAGAFQMHEIAPHEILHVGTRLEDDLAEAKRAGMRTALYAADKISTQVTKEQVRDPELRPDRLLTDLRQIREILSIA